MTQRTIGIDLAIRGEHVAQIYDDGQPAGGALRFRHDPDSLDAFLAQALEGLPDGSCIQAVMEPTGMNWFPVAHRLADDGISVARVKGKRVKAYLSEHAKTDLAEARVLAAMPGFGGPRLDTVHIPAAKSLAVQRLTKQMSRLPDDVASAKRRLLDLIRWASPAIKRVLPDLRTCLSLAVLKEWLDPDVVLKARHPRLRRFMAKHASGNHPHIGRFVEQLIDSLRDAARDARRLHRHHVDFGEPQAGVAPEIGIMQNKIAAIHSLERRIKKLYAELDPKALLASIPGIGRTLAPALPGVLHTLDRFHSERHMRGFCGLFPRRSDSGGAERPGQSITQGGNDRVKRALVLAADTTRKVDPELAEVHARLMIQKGHHHKQALCAVANRLANRIYSVMRRGTPYILHDNDGVPITIDQARTIIAKHYTVPETVRAGSRANRGEMVA